MHTHAQRKRENKTAGMRLSFRSSSLRFRPWIETHPLSAEPRGRSTSTDSNMCYDTSASFISVSWALQKCRLKENVHRLLKSFLEVHSTVPSRHMPEGEERVNRQGSHCQNRCNAAGENKSRSQPESGWKNQTEYVHSEQIHRRLNARKKTEDPTLVTTDFLNKVLKWEAK